jgi:GNAT superfamily N-acetyltransferase
MRKSERMPPTLRPACAGDAARVAALAEQLGYAVSEADARARLPVLAADPLQALFVAELEGRVLGWIHVCEEHTLLFEPYAEIVGLIVDATARSRGLGAALLARAEQWAVERGLGVVHLRSRTTRERAHAFYLREGYRITKTQHAFERVLARGHGVARPR